MQRQILLCKKTMKEEIKEKKTLEETVIQTEKKRKDINCRKIV